MCLLLALVDVVEGHPFVAVANRDEYFDRGSEPPASRGGDPEVWCGLDRRAGGTWLGMNAAGVVVVLTNRRGEQDTTRTSRGGAARGALDRRSARDAAAFAAAWAAVHVPNPFSLFAADARGAWFVPWAGPDDGASVVELSPGLHTLTNTHDLDELPAAEVLRAADGGPVEFPRGIALAGAEPLLLRIAKSHAPLDGGPRSAVCVHGEGRGTVSSALLAVRADGRPARFLAADGAPCVTRYRDVLVTRSR
jgi:hypothetical protein